MRNKRRNIIIILIILVFTLGFSTNKLNTVYNHKTVALAFSKAKKYKVVTEINKINDYKDFEYGDWLYNDIFIKADKIYEIYSYELAEQGFYDSNYVVLLGDELLKDIKMNDVVEITYIDVDLIPARIEKGVVITDATTASIIIDIKRINYKDVL